MQSQICLLDLSWHVGCIGKLQRSKKVKAGSSAPKIITDDEKKEAKRLALERVISQRNGGGARRIPLDNVGDTLLQGLSKLSKEST